MTYTGDFVQGHISGIEVLFRPIHPGDAKTWYKFVVRCSKHTIYTRYQHAVQFDGNDVEKYVNIDISEEIAYVSTIDFMGTEVIVGEVRLYISPEDHATAEFAILVTDEWQSKGIGSFMTTEIINIATKRGITKIIAYTENDNHKMLKVFQKMGFDKNSDFLSQTVDLVKLLPQ